MGSHSTSRSTEFNCRGHKELWGKSPHIWGQEISEMRCFVRNKGDTQKRNIAGKKVGKKKERRGERERKEKEGRKKERKILGRKLSVRRRAPILSPKELTSLETV